MHQPTWVTDLTTFESRQRRQPRRDSGGEEIESDAAGRFVFTSVRASATDAVFIFSQIVRCKPSVPPRGPGLHFTKGSESAGSAQQTSGTRRSRDTSLSKLLSAAQQYLQALREDRSPPRELREAWDAFYRAYDPLVRRTVAACSLHHADEDDSVQEAWAEIAAKLTRFEYDETRGSFESWLRIVVHRAACHHARRDHRQTAGRIDQDLAAVKCPRLLGPATTSQQKELCVSVRQTLDAFRTSVSSAAFQVLVMTAVHDQTSIEIGKLLGLSPGHIRVSRHRTVKKFREFVAEQPGLADALGVSSPAIDSAETTGNPRRDQFAEYSETSPNPL